MTDEIWKPISGYEGIYEVSNLGRVRSCDRIVEDDYCGKRRFRSRVLRQSQNHSGYCQVKLSKNSKVTTFRVHRLVAEVFVQNPLSKETVNHKNEIKTDNRAKNLEWMTPKENTNYGTRNERAGKASGMTRGKPIQQFTQNGEFVAEYWSAREASRQTKIPQGSISHCANGSRRYPHPGGYIWRYKEGIK